MSKAMTADQVVAQLKKWRVPHKGTLGWRTRRRPASTGAWGDVHGSLNHHTAGATGAKARQELKVLKGGRSDLPGPLCHFSPARNGVVWLVSIGRANHAGSVRLQVRTRFQHSLGPQRPTGTDGETVDGNAFLYGTEVQNNGLGEHFPDAQLLSLVLLNAAICDFHHWDANAVAQHKEVTARKADMHNIRGEPSGPWLRTEVSVALKAGPGKYTRVGWRPPPPPPVLPACNHACPRHCTKG